MYLELPFSSNFRYPKQYNTKSCCPCEVCCVLKKISRQFEQMFGCQWAWARCTTASPLDATLPLPACAPSASQTRRSAVAWNDDYSKLGRTSSLEWHDKLKPNPNIDYKPATNIINIRGGQNLIGSWKRIIKKLLQERGFGVCLLCL
jgi:hypothetical protein